MSKIRVNVISETEFTVKGHGVHTAYVELTTALRKRDDIDLSVNTDREVDVTHIHTIGLYALRRLLFGPGKKVFSAHVVPDSFVGSLVGAKYWLPLARLYLRWLYNKSDLVLAVSDETKRQLLAMGVTSQIEVFYNVIDTSRYAPGTHARATARKKLGIAEDAWAVVGAGQIQPRKRIDSFVRAAKNAPDVTFIWVGGMPFKQLAASSVEMQHLIDTAPSNVIFTGIVELEEMQSYYHAADVFFLPSNQETFGLVVVEAAAAGLPIILRDIHDYDETFRPYGVMAKGKTFVSAITRLRDDRAYRKSMIANVHKLAALYDSRSGAKRLRDLYQRLLER